jgi:hypothetical protein
VYRFRRHLFPGEIARRFLTQPYRKDTLLPGFSISNLPARLATAAAATAATARTPATTTAATAGPAATTAAAEPAASATTTKSAIRLGSGFVHIQCAPVEAVAIQRLNGLIRFRFVLHFHKRETAGTAGVAIGHDPGAVHCAVSFEETTYGLFGCVEIQIPYENILHSNPPKQI